MQHLSYRSKKYIKSGLQGNMEYQNNLTDEENRDFAEQETEDETGVSAKVVTEAEEAADLGTFDSI